MDSDRIQIDDARLRANLLAYLRTPAAEPIFEEFDTPWWACLIGVAILATIACCMLPTIIWTLDGLKALWSVLKLEPLAELSKSVRDDPESLVPLVVHGVIIGPDQKHALGLGTFLTAEEYSVDWLASQAERMGKLYKTDSPPAQDRPLWELLRDDNYRPYRRRRVPEPFAEGQEFYLFDVEVDPSEGAALPGVAVLFAMVATSGEKGEIKQLPWAVTQGAVEIR
ncbi:MAG: hypothetical protein L0211_15340 [Planctomycetaceae bacterium]|nr:hypothetical protein [Planctomycetaceae bacterium]